jgi:ADP-heptose:LPS heptosyltransferase
MLGLLGDVLMRTPLLRELKKIFPDAEILCVADPIGAQVLELCPAVDQIVITDRSKKSRLKYVIEKIKLQLKMSLRRHDLMIDLYGGKSSRRLVSLSRAERKLVIRSGMVESKGLAKQKVLTYLNPYHMSNVQLQVLAYFPSIQNASLSTRPYIKVSPTMLDSVDRQYLDSLALGRQHFVMSMGAGDPQKVIALDKIAALCRFIVDSYRLIPVVLCNPGQEFIQQDISDKLNILDVGHIRLRVISISAIACLMQKVNFVVVPDTGLFHLALGVGAPILSIFTHTNPELVRPDGGEYEICFQADSSKGFSVEGLPYGTGELNSDYLHDMAAKLISRLDLKA